MTKKCDYSSEIIGLIILTVLSALSHFWLIMIAICAVSIAAGAGYLISRLILRASSEVVERLHTLSVHNKATAASDLPDSQVTPSFPAA
jgi:hypothetical protein